MLRRTAPARVAAAWRWFTALRRSRPFWGCLWLVAGGWTVLRYTLEPLQVVITHGIGGVGGWLTGGGMIVCGLVPLVRPSQRYTFGVLGMVFAVTSLVVSNLGGFLAGMLLGILGGAMAVGWGPKRERRRHRRRERVSAAEAG